MNYRLSLILVLLLFVICGFSQTDKEQKKLISVAQKLFEKEQYKEAMSLYSQLLSLYPSSPDYSYKYGACLIENNRKIEKSIKFLSYASKKLSEETLIYYYLGKAYHLEYQFELALENYRLFKSKASSKLIKDKNINREIDICNNGLQLIKYVSFLNVFDNKPIKEKNFHYSYPSENMGGKLVVKPNEFKTKVDLKQNRKELIFISDSNIVLFSSLGNSKKGNLDLYWSIKNKDGEFGIPQKFGRTINTNYDEQYPFLKADGKTLYFSSKGHNTMGGYDIFKSVYDSLTNKWSKAQNLDFPINTPYDDLLYAVDGDGKYAYFVSNRETKEDGLNIYKIGVEENPVLRTLDKVDDIKELSKLNITPVVQDYESENQEEEQGNVALAHTQVAEFESQTPKTEFEFNQIYSGYLNSEDDYIDLLKDDLKILKKDYQNLLNNRNVCANIAVFKSNKVNDLNQWIDEAQKNSSVEKLVKDSLFINKFNEVESLNNEVLFASKMVNNITKELLVREKEMQATEKILKDTSLNNTQYLIQKINSNRKQIKKNRNSFLSVKSQISSKKNAKQQLEQHLYASKSEIDDLENKYNIVSQRVKKERLGYQKSNSLEKEEAKKKWLSTVDELEEICKVLINKQDSYFRKQRASKLLDTEIALLKKLENKDLRYFYTSQNSDFSDEVNNKIQERTELLSKKYRVSDSLVFYVNTLQYEDGYTQKGLENKDKVVLEGVDSSILTSNQIEDTLQVDSGGDLLEKLLTESVDSNNISQKLFRYNSIQSDSLNNEQSPTHEIDLNLVSDHHVVQGLALQEHQIKQYEAYAEEYKKAQIIANHKDSINQLINLQEDLLERMYSQKKRKKQKANINKLKKDKLQLFLQSSAIEEKANNKKYNLLEELIQEKIKKTKDEKHKLLANNYLLDAQFFNNQISKIKLDTSLDVADLTSLQERRIALSRQAVQSQEFALKSLYLNMNDDFFVVQNTSFVKIDKTPKNEADFNQDLVKKVRKIKMFELINLSDSDAEILKESDDLEQKKCKIQKKYDKNQKEIIALNKSCSLEENKAKYKKIKKKISKLEAKSQVYISNIVKISESINFKRYKVYKENLKKYRDDNDKKFAEGVRYEKEAQQIFKKSINLRKNLQDETDGGKIYQLLHMIESLELASIDKIQKAYASYLNMQPIVEEVASFLEEKTDTIVSSTNFTKLIVDTDNESARIITIGASSPNEIVVSEPFLDNDQDELEPLELTTTNEKLVEEIVGIDEIESYEKDSSLIILAVPEDIVISESLTDNNQDGLDSLDVLNIGESRLEEIKDVEVEESFLVEESVIVSDSLINDSSESVRKEEFEESSEIETGLIHFNFKIETGNMDSEDSIEMNPILPNGIVYKIQIGAFLLPVREDAFKGVTPVTGETRDGSRYVRYFAGLFDTYEAANSVLPYIRQFGYLDAFIVAYIDGKQISLTTARDKDRQESGYQRIAVLETAKVQSQIIQANNGVPLVQQSFENDVNPSQPIQDINGVLYTIQVGVYKTHISHDRLYNLKPLFNDYTSSGLVKYTVGRFVDYNRAILNRNKIRKVGVKDAFVIAYKDGNRISISQAQKELISATKSTISSDISQLESVKISEPINSENLYYAVQIGAYTKIVPVEEVNSLLNVVNLGKIFRFIDDKARVIYTIGKFKSMSDASDLKNQVVSLGFTDAFVIAFDGKKKVPVSKVRGILQP